MYVYVCVCMIDRENFSVFASSIVVVSRCWCVSVQIGSFACDVFYQLPQTLITLHHHETLKTTKQRLIIRIQNNSLSKRSNVLTYI